MLFNYKDEILERSEIRQKYCSIFRNGGAYGEQQSFEDEAFAHLYAYPSMDDCIPAITNQLGDLEQCVKDR